jgi:hypothetical protein
MAVKVRIHHVLAMSLSLAAHALAPWLAAGPMQHEQAGGRQHANVLTVRLATPSLDMNEHDPGLSSSDPTDEMVIEAAQAGMATMQRAGEAPASRLNAKQEPQYFRLSELTEKPQVLHDTAPDPFPLLDVPPQTATLRLLINEYGDIDRVEIEQSDLPDLVARALVDSFSKTKFRPGKRDAVAVKSQLKIEVRLESVLTAP